MFTFYGEKNAACHTAVTNRDSVQCTKQVAKTEFISV